MSRHIKKIFNVATILIAWFYLHIFQRHLLKEDIWIIREKKNEARDNGYHFFRYLKEKHPQINSYYVITSSSPDLHKVLRYGNVIKADSFQHCVYYLASRYNISSQPFGAFPFIFSNKELMHIGKLCNRKQKTIFLQHGITKDNLSHDFIYKKCNIDYFVCSAEKEYEFVKRTYEYPDEAIGLVGLARFDELHKPNKKENIILIMPTWRRWLSCASTNNIPTQHEKNNFETSKFYQEYANLLSDKEIIDLLHKEQYQIVFYLHYKIQGYTDLFKKFDNHVVKIATKEEYDVQELLTKSKVLITDYSSVYFDFAYMNKPLMYFQFDKEEFNKLHYAKGYFSYENDGFGPCCTDNRALKEELKKILAEDCKQSQKYEERVNSFFGLRDTHNCERIYQAICKL